MNYFINATAVRRHLRRKGRSLTPAFLEKLDLIVSAQIMSGALNLPKVKVWREDEEDLLAQHGGIILKPRCFRCFKRSDTVKQFACADCRKKDEAIK